MPAVCGFVQLNPDAPSVSDALARMGDDNEPGLWESESRFVNETQDVGVHSWQFGTASPVAETGGLSLALDGYVVNRTQLASEVGVDDPSFSDARLLLELWHQNRVSRLEHVEGDYNFVVTDGDGVHVVSSRLGARHLYWYWGESYVAFATRMSAIARLPGFAPQVDRMAMLEMFNFGYIGADRSLLEGVRLLPGATCLTIQSGTVRQQRYWDLQFANDTGATNAVATGFEEYVEEAVEAYRESVDGHSQRFEQITVPLSGGLDSRTLLAFAAQQRAGIPVHHVSWYGAEAQIARQLAIECGADWHEYDPLGFDYSTMLADGDLIAQGNIHCHQFWFLPVIQSMATTDSPSIVLDGYLMDVLFGDTFLILPERTDASQADTVSAINRLWRRCRPELVKKVFSSQFYDDYEAANAHSITSQLEGLDEPSLTNRVQAFSFQNRSNRYSVALPNVQRQYADYAYPGTSRRLIELYRQIPPHFKKGSQFSRAIVSRADPGVAAVSWAKTGRPLDQDKGRLDRLVERFPVKQAGAMLMLRASGGKLDLSHRADLNRHFRQHSGFRRAFLDIAEQERTLSRGIIDADGLRRLVSMIDRGWPALFLLQTLVTVELFHRRFIDEA